MRRIGGCDVQVWAATELAEYEPALRAALGALCRQPSDLDDLIQDTRERACTADAGSIARSIIEGE